MENISQWKLLELLFLSKWDHFIFTPSLLCILKISLAVFSKILEALNFDSFSRVIFTSTSSSTAISD